jgi:hypothetical protein
MNMSTYEFIVNSRERKLQPDDHEAARQSSQGTPISLKHLRVSILVLDVLLLLHVALMAYNIEDKITEF